MNTELITEKVIKPAKGIPVLLLDLLMLIVSIVLACFSIPLFDIAGALVGALALPIYQLWALAVVAVLSVVGFAAARRFCPDVVTRKEVPFMTGKEDADQMLGSVDDPLYYDKVIPANERVLESHLDREPRFYANIAFDRGYWRGIIKSTDEEDNPLVVMARRGETFGTYLTDLQSDGYQNRTGYWLLKHLYLDVPCDGYSTQVDSKGALPMPLIRMAQLYLMSSEAWNEYLDAPNEDVYAGIDTVRSRAGIPDVRTAWTRYSNQPDKPTSKVGMRDIIRRETTIELAFEGQRFWDLRRWLIAHEVLNEPLYGWNVVATEESGFYNNFLGPIVVWSLRGFTAPRVYFWPISSSEVMRSGVVQNPGW